MPYIKKENHIKENIKNKLNYLLFVLIIIISLINILSIFINFIPLGFVLLFSFAIEIYMLLAMLNKYTLMTGDMLILTLNIISFVWSVLVLFFNMDLNSILGLNFI